MECKDRYKVYANYFVYADVIEKLCEISEYLKAKQIDSEISVIDNIHALIHECFFCDFDDDYSSLDYEFRHIVDISLFVYDISGIIKLINIIKELESVESISWESYNDTSICKDLLNFNDTYKIQIRFKDNSYMILSAVVGSNEICLEPILIEKL